MINIEQLLSDPLYRLFIRVISVQFVALITVLAAVVFIRLRRIRQRRERLAANRSVAPVLVRYLSNEIPLSEVIKTLKPLRKDDAAELLEAYASSIASRLQDDLVALYRGLGLIAFAVRRSRSIIWWRRLEAVRILGMLEGKVEPQILFDRLRDPVPAVRLAAARGLGRSGDPRAVDPLLASLATPAGISRPQIAAILVDLGSSAHPRLRALLRKPPQTRAEARLYATILEVLALSGDTRSAPYIQYALTDQDHEIRIAAFRAAGILRLTLAPDDIIMGLEDDRWEVRAQAARTAGRVGLKEMVSHLATRLSDTSWWVRLNAASALRDLGDSGLAELARIASDSNDPFARDMAQRILTEDPHTGSNYLLGRGATMLSPVITAPVGAPAPLPRSGIENFWEDEEGGTSILAEQLPDGGFDELPPLPPLGFDEQHTGFDELPPLAASDGDHAALAPELLPPLAFEFDIDDDNFSATSVRDLEANR